MASLLGVGEMESVGVSDVTVEHLHTPAVHVLRICCVLVPTSTANIFSASNRTLTAAQPGPFYRLLSGTPLYSPLTVTPLLTPRARNTRTCWTSTDTITARHIGIKNQPRPLPPTGASVPDLSFPASVRLHTPQAEAGRARAHAKQTPHPLPSTLYPRAMRSRFVDRPVHRHGWL